MHIECCNEENRTGLAGLPLIIWK